MMQSKDRDADTEWKWKNKCPGVDGPDRQGERSACGRHAALRCLVFRASSIHFFFTKYWVLHVPGPALGMKQQAQWAWCLFSRGQARISLPGRRRVGPSVIETTLACLFSLFPGSQIAPQRESHHPSMTHLGVLSFFYYWINFLSFLLLSLSLFKAFLLANVISRTESLASWEVKSLEKYITVDTVPCTSATFLLIL